MIADTAAARPRARRRPARPHFQTAPMLSAEEEQALAARVKAGDARARDALVLANLRLVLSIASDFRCPNRGVELDDLIQEGNIGLMRAARDFDPEAHGTRFATYASYWIRHHIQRVLAEHASIVRFPYYLVILRRRFEKARDLLIEAGRSAPNARGCQEPTMDEVADRMGVEPRKLKFVRHAQIEMRSYSTAAHDDVEDEDESHNESLAQLIPPEGPIEIAETMERLHTSMRKLTLLESWVLRRRYRLDDTSKEAEGQAEARSRRRESPRRRSAAPGIEGRRAYREISQEIGRPIHQIRQVELAAIARLRDMVDCPFEGPAPAASPTSTRTPPLSRRIGLRRSA